MTTTNEIQVGSKVRSFDDGNFRDLTGPDASYVEGTVIGFTDHEGCPRYRILVSRIVKRDGERPVREEHIVIPPVNGIPIWGDEDNLTNGVEIIQ